MLIGHASPDQMWGDGVLLGAARGGADTFMLAPGGGDDVIYDFRHVDHDRIDLSAFAFHAN